MDKDELRSYDLRAEEMSINLTANFLRVSLLMARLTTPYPPLPISFSIS